jgi:hypothetical protein
MRTENLSPMTEDQIERHVERMVDRLDRRFLNSSMSQAEYDSEMKQVSLWADAEYRFIRTRG